MSLTSALRVALESLCLHKGRSLLTSLGIVIGIAGVIALVSAGNGARLKLDEQLALVGKNLIIIRPGGRTVSGTLADYVPLTREDADALRRQPASFLLCVAPIQTEQRTVTAGTRNCSTSVVGTTPDLEMVGNWRLLHGRFIDPADIRRPRFACSARRSAAGSFPTGPIPSGPTCACGGSG